MFYLIVPNQNLKSHKKSIISDFDIIGIFGVFQRIKDNFTHVFLKLVSKANYHLTKILKITLIIDLPNGKTLAMLRHTTTFLFAEKRNLIQKMNEL